MTALLLLLRQRPLKAHHTHLEDEVSHTHTHSNIYKFLQAHRSMHVQENQNLHQQIQTPERKSED